MMAETYAEQKKRAREVYKYISESRPLRMVKDNDYSNRYDPHWLDRIIDLDEDLYGQVEPDGDYEIW